MNYQTYLFFEGRTEYIQGYDTPQHTYPLGSLVFGVLDLDAAPYLERGRALLERFRGVKFPEDQTMQQSLAAPDTCVYYQVASFYHDFAAAVQQVSPALFDLVEGYALANFRRNERELKATQHCLWQFIQTGKNDSSYTFDELRTRMSHFGELAITSDIMEGFCRNFPEYTDQMKVFIQRDTGDASLCRTALSVLESFVTLLQQLVDGKTDLRQLIEATLVDEDGRPRTEHDQRPSELLVELAENGDSTYQKYHELEDDIHIQTRYKRPTDNKKGGISAATFYASDTLPALLFLEFVQMCAQDLPVAVCESCHRLFIPFSSRAKYCERVLDPETGATCKDIAAKLAYAEELKANKAKELYNKMRNRYQMRCSRAPDNQKMRDDYNAWRKQAQMALSKYQLGGVRKGYSQRTIMSLFVGESKFLLLWMMATVFNAIFQSQQQRPCQQPQQATAERKYLGAEQLIPNRICQGSKCHQALLGKIAQVHPEIHIRPSAGNQPARQSGQEIRQCQCCHQKQRECSHLTSHLSKRGQSPQLMQEEQCSNR